MKNHERTGVSTVSTIPDQMIFMRKRRGVTQFNQSSLAEVARNHQNGNIQFNRGLPKRKPNQMLFQDLAR